MQNETEQVFPKNDVAVHVICMATTQYAKLACRISSFTADSHGKFPIKRTLLAASYTAKYNKSAIDDTLMQALVCHRSTFRTSVNDREIM